MVVWPGLHGGEHGVVGGDFRGGFREGGAGREQQAAEGKKECAHDGKDGRFFRRVQREES